MRVGCAAGAGGCQPLPALHAAPATVDLGGETSEQSVASPCLGARTRGGRMADGEAAQVVTEDESSRLTREAMENLEVGRLLRGMFAAGATFFQIQVFDGDFTAYQLP